MPHATENDATQEAAAIANAGSFMDFGNDSFGEGFGQGEKDDDAQDFSDISDDDLPEEEEATNEIEHDEAEDKAIAEYLKQSQAGEPSGEVLPRATQNTATISGELNGDDGDVFGNDADVNDLFGERMSISPVEERHPDPSAARQQTGLALPGRSGLALPKGAPKQNGTAHSPSSYPASPPSLDHGSESPEDIDELDDVDDPTLRAQMQLFKISRMRMEGEAVDWDPVATQDENKFWQQFPTWDPDAVPQFCELLPPVPGRFRAKVPLKPPKALQATKVSIDLLQDQEKSFKALTSSGKAVQDGYQGRNVVVIEDAANEGEEDDLDFDTAELDMNEKIGPVTMQDLAILCQDWKMPSPTITAEESADAMLEGEYNATEAARPAKKPKLETTESILQSQHAFNLRLDEPERVTAKIAKTVTLDMNDPYLLLDEQVPQIRRKVRDNNTQTAAANRDLARRYNISNDEAYDLLKENHQHKVRSTLGSMAIEHSLPASRLQFPFYKVALDGKEKRAFHRPHLSLYEHHGRTYRVSKPKYHKKKHVRGREAKDLFAKAEDLSFGDNASIFLVEYSEEMPTALSNFGMGNRLINYYRKRNAEDQERPKRELGEVSVLLGQDKSPFANFGHVDAGETVPTIQNGLYRAPIFQHESKNTDFILATQHTHENGIKMYLKNMENLHVAGQQLPIAEVPGEHSRRVTDAAKKRLRAISYRIHNKNMDPSRRGPPLTNKVLMRHIPGSDIPQTRSKMREFMKYEKRAKNSDDDGFWVPMPGQVVPDPETIRGWIKPEDICLLDATQVGVQHLHDLGISTSKNEEENEDEELEDGAHIEKQLAPWQTTKNFIAATQGKAMLQLHGEGDPTGRGEAFSFIRTSMKGGYIAEGESVDEKINDRKRKEQGGHKYNVAHQQAKYDSSIRKIWDRQKESLTNDNEMSESEMEDDADGEGYPFSSAATPRPGFGTPAAGFDDSASQFSKHSTEQNGEVLVLKRVRKDPVLGDFEEDEPLLVTNPKVIKLYRKRKQEQRLARLRFALARRKNEHNANEMSSHRDLLPTGNAEIDALAQQEIKKELARLERNADRRVAREKQKRRIAAATGGTVDVNDQDEGSPSLAAGTPESEAGTASKTATPNRPGKGRTKDGTARKCANCGQVGHIKTNRKLCPMLNGTMRPEDAPGAQNSSFGAVPAQLTL